MGTLPIATSDESRPRGRFIGSTSSHPGSYSVDVGHLAESALDLHDGALLARDETGKLIEWVAPESGDLVGILIEPDPTELAVHGGRVTYLARYAVIAIEHVQIPEGQEAEVLARLEALIIRPH